MLKAIAYDPRDRYQSAEEMLRDLEAAAEGENRKKEAKPDVKADAVDASPTAARVSAPEEEKAQPSPSRGKPRKKPWLPILLGLATVLTVGMAILLLPHGAEQARPAPSLTHPIATIQPFSPETEESAEKADEPAAAEDKETNLGPVSFTGSYLMGTGSDAGTYYQFGSAVCTVVNQVTGADLAVTATGGPLQNVQLLHDGEAELGLVTSDTFSYAHQGIELFDGSHITNFKAITACYPEMVQIVVRKDSGISSVADMAGKKICVGIEGTASEAAARR